MVILEFLISMVAIMYSTFCVPGARRGGVGGEEEGEEVSVRPGREGYVSSNGEAGDREAMYTTVGTEALVRIGGGGWFRLSSFGVQEHRWNVERETQQATAMQFKGSHSIKKGGGGGAMKSCIINGI